MAARMAQSGRQVSVLCTRIKKVGVRVLVMGERDHAGECSVQLEEPPNLAYDAESNGLQPNSSHEMSKGAE